MLLLSQPSNQFRQCLPNPPRMWTLLGPILAAVFVPSAFGQSQRRRPSYSVLAPQGWKFISCSHCQELDQQTSWLLIGCITNQMAGQQVDPILDPDSNSQVSASACWPCPGADLTSLSSPSSPSSTSKDIHILHFSQGGKKVFF